MGFFQRHSAGLCESIGFGLDSGLGPDCLREFEFFRVQLSAFSGKFALTC